MKRLILIGGPMGVGKTSSGRALCALLPNSAFLDGDWCWDIHPFIVNDETKALVLDNIRHLLRGYLRCSAVENIVFCWVMQMPEIAETVLAGLPLEGVEVRRITLLASPEALEARLRADIDAGRRAPDVIGRSRSYLSLCAALDGEKLDTTNLRVPEVARALCARLF